MLIDTHAHLFLGTDQFSYETDLAEVLERAKENGINTILNVGVDQKTSQIALDQCLSPLFEQSGIKFYSSIGIHPEEAVKFTKETDQKLAQAMSDLEEIYHKNPKKVVAVGEVGLDYTIEAHPEWAPTLSFDEIKILQKKLFSTQIALAKKLNLPLLVHVRDNRSVDHNNSDCWEDTIALSKDHFGIYHCYSGKGDVLEKITTNTSFLISFAGNLTYPNNHYLKEACQKVSLDRVVLETDCPFLPPQPIRGKRNEPAQIKTIAEFVAEVKGLSLEEVAEKTSHNASRYLNLH